MINSFTSSFLIWVPSFFFFFPDCLARPSKTVLNKSSESEHPCLVPDLRGKAFNFSPLTMILDVGLLYMAFIMLRYVPSMATFWGVGCLFFVFFFFYHEWVLSFIKSFPYMY